VIAPERPGQHRDLPGTDSATSQRQPRAGVVSIEPSQPQEFVDAVVAGGAVVAPLSGETTGLVWLSEKRAPELSALLESHPQIDWVQLPWAGVDGFRNLFESLDHDSAPVFTSAKGSYSQPVAEHALALVLGLARELPRKARDARWQTERTGLSLFGNHIVIIGAGGITREFIRLVSPFSPRITVVRRNVHAMEGADRTVGVDSLREVLSDADVLIIAAAATAETAHLIGQPEIAALPAHAIVVNVARGELLDADAVLTALREDRLWGVGLDVSDPEPLPADSGLWNEPRCVITSHSADTPLMTKFLLAERIRTNVAHLVAGEPLIGVVDTRSGY
jgi:phosphoglycerate dehydrogenase-like enzyme